MFPVKKRHFLHGIASILLGMSTVMQTHAAEPDCASVKDQAERLQCYDRRFGSAGQHPETTDQQEQGTQHPQSTSIWEERILQDADREPFTLTARKPNYIMDTYQGNPNRAPYEFTGEADQIKDQEIKYQLSFQTKMGDNLIGQNGDLWFTYTQVVYWQLFADNISSPFRETNYAPEVYLSFLTNVDLLGLTMRNVNFGVVHQSNGRGDPLSRSWNRVYAEMQFVKDDFALSFKPWYRIQEDPSDDNNPDIQDYMGHYEIWAYYNWDKQVLSGMLRNVFSSGDRHNFEANWSFPIVKHLRGIVQYYNGYGEDLIDYNYYSHRIGVGVMLTDWL